MRVFAAARAGRGLIALLMLGHFAALHAQTGVQAAAAARVIEVAHDNDQLAFTPGSRERWYSSGLFLRTAAPAQASDPDARLLQAWCAHVIACDTGARIDRLWGLSQLIHTPAWTGTALPQPADWPYAASLFGTLGVSAQGELTCQTLSVQLGVLGPAAQGEPVQNSVHRMLGQPLALGFPLQVGPQPVAQLTWSRLAAQPLPTSGVDWVSRTTVTLGRPLTQASAGVLLRVGERPDGPSWPGEIQLPGTSTRRAYGWAGVDLRAVAVQRYIDGPTSAYESLVHHRTGVAHLLAGGSLALGGRTWLDVGLEWRTLEFSAPPGSRSMSPQRIGTLLLRHDWI